MLISKYVVVSVAAKFPIEFRSSTLDFSKGEYLRLNRLKFPKYVIFTCSYCLSIKTSALCWEYLDAYKMLSFVKCIFFANFDDLQTGKLGSTS